VLTTRVNADDPAAFDTWVGVRAPDGALLAEDDDGDSGTDSLIAGLRLPEDGIYEIEVRSYNDESGGVYTLVIESSLSAAITPTPSSISPPTVTLTPMP
jgi:hypothetical protein